MRGFIVFLGATILNTIQKQHIGYYDSRSGQRTVAVVFNFGTYSNYPTFEASAGQNTKGEKRKEV